MHYGSFVQDGMGHIDLKHAAGSIFIFDSNIDHNVNVVESGVRYSMNAWPSSKIKKGLL